MLAKFEHEETEWNSWRFRFENFVELMGVSEEKHLEFLIKSLEKITFRTLESMCRPKKRSGLVNRDIVGKMDVAYNRVTFMVAEWPHFFYLGNRKTSPLCNMRLNWEIEPSHAIST